MRYEQHRLNRWLSRYNSLQTPVESSVEVTHEPLLIGSVLEVVIGVIKSMRYEHRSFESMAIEL